MLGGEGIGDLIKYRGVWLTPATHTHTYSLTNKKDRSTKYCRLLYNMNLLLIFFWLSALRVLVRLGQFVSKI